MTTKTMTLTLRLTLSDLPDDFRQRLADDEADGHDDLPDIHDVKAADVGERATSILVAMGDMLWDGSDDYAVLDKAVVVSAAWDEVPG